MKEKDIENSILKYLTLSAIGYFWKVNSTGVFDPKKKTFRRKSKFDINGVSDILGIIGGRMIAIEVKTPVRIKQVSEAQHEFLYNVNSNGGLGFVATSIQDVLDVFREEGMINYLGMK